MTSDVREEQRREWVALYNQIRPVLQQFGEEDDHPGRKDYWLVNENLGLWQHRIETSNLEMVRPVVIKSLRKLLIAYPNWEITIAVTSPGAENVWPVMASSFATTKSSTGCSGNIFRRSFRPSSTKEAGRRGRGLETSSIRGGPSNT